jgi:hypothetical protein
MSMAPDLAEPSPNITGTPQPAPAPSAQPPKKARPGGSWLSRGIAIFGIVFLSYLLGAAVMFFELPSAEMLQKAFVGARAWSERRAALAEPPQTQLPGLLMGKVDRPDRTFDGFTLCIYAKMQTSNTRAFLLDMRGTVVHTWSVPFSRVWSSPPHMNPPPDDALVCFFGCHLCPNGDLLVVFHGLEKFAAGYGLAKLDKNSNVLWRYPAHVHHDVDVGEDGTIFAVQHARAETMPKGLELIPTPTLVDSLVRLSPEGKLLGPPISILEAFRDSPYAPLLDELKVPNEDVRRGMPAWRLRGDTRGLDTLHTNCVHVLTRELAAKFPQFQAGQVLLSLRNLSTIAVLDLEKRSIVWAAKGPWQAQHDAHFLANGHLLVFDNLGSPRGSRVLEYDPQTQSFPWSYFTENEAPFFSPERGMSQRLPNGNTLIVDSQGHQIREVAANKEVVWSCELDGFINVGRRFSPESLPFLKGGPRARP